MAVVVMAASVSWAGFWRYVVEDLRPAWHWVLGCWAWTVARLEAGDRDVWLALACMVLAMLLLALQAGWFRARRRRLAARLAERTEVLAAIRGLGARLDAVEAVLKQTEPGTGVRDCLKLVQELARAHAESLDGMLRAILGIPAGPPRAAESSPGTEKAVEAIRAIRGLFSDSTDSDYDETLAAVERIASQPVDRGPEWPAGGVGVLLGRGGGKDMVRMHKASLRAIVDLVQRLDPRVEPADVDDEEDDS